MESPLLKAAEPRPAEFEASGHQLHVSLLQDVFDHLRISRGQDETESSVKSSTFGATQALVKVSTNTYKHTAEDATKVMDAKAVPVP